MKKAEIVIVSLKALAMGLTLVTTLVEGKVQTKEIAKAVEAYMESKGKS